MHHIYRTPIIDRQLNRLRKSDKKGKRAARQIDAIINTLASCTNPLEKLRRKQTRYGELRLSNCRKYDLGSGYRLITVCDEGCIILAFAGSHDECHLWLEKQKNTTLNILSLKTDCTLIPATPGPQGYEVHSPPTEPAFEQDPYEKGLLQRVDEKTLRYVFRGLCRST